MSGLVTGTGAVLTTVASVLSAALASTNTSTASLATQVAEALDEARAATAAESQTAAASMTGSGNQSGTQLAPTEARTQAIDRVRQVIAAQCSSCNFSQADLEKWFSGS